MLKKLVFPEKTKVTVSLISIVLVILFVTTACSTIDSVRSENTTADQTAASLAAGQTIVLPGDTDGTPGNDASMSKTSINKIPIDETRDNWANARALYLRTLDYAQIDQQDNSPTEYSVKRNLVESRYWIKESETALYVEHNTQKALRELRIAMQRYEQATDSARSGAFRTIKKPQSDLNALIKLEIQVCNQGCCEYPQHEQYVALETEIENLLQTL